MKPRKGVLHPLEEVEITCPYCEGYIAAPNGSFRWIIEDKDCTETCISCNQKVQISLPWNRQPKRAAS